MSDCSPTTPLLMESNSASPRSAVKRFPPSSAAVDDDGNAFSGAAPTAASPLSNRYVSSPANSLRQNPFRSRIQIDTASQDAMDEDVVPRASDDAEYDDAENTDLGHNDDDDDAVDNRKAVGKKTLGIGILLFVFRLLFFIIVPCLVLAIGVWRFNVVSIVYLFVLLLLHGTARLRVSSVTNHVTACPKALWWYVLCAVIVAYMFAQIISQFTSAGDSGRDVFGLGRLSCSDALECTREVVVYLLLDVFLLVSSIVGIVLEPRLRCKLDTRISKFLKGDYGAASVASIMPILITFRTLFICIVLIFTALTVLARASFFNVPLLFFLVIVVYRYSFHKPMLATQTHVQSKFYSSTLVMVTTYSWIVLFALYISFIMGSTFPRGSGTEEVGFYDFTNSSQLSWPAAVSVSCLFFLAVYSIRAIEYHNAVYKLMVSTKDFQNQTSSLPRRLKQFVYLGMNKVGVYLTAACLVATAVLFISVLDVGLLCMGFYGLMSRQSGRARLLFLRYCFGVCVPILFLSYVYGVFVDHLKQDAIQLLSNIVHFMLTVICGLSHYSIHYRMRQKNQEATESSPSGSYVPPTIVIASDAASVSDAVTPGTSQSPMLTNSASRKPHGIPDGGGVGKYEKRGAFRTFVAECFYLGVREFDRLTLLLVYVAALSDVSILHTVFLLFFLLFFIFRSLSLKHWNFLVIYTMAAMLSLYIFYIVVSFSGAGNSVVSEIFGYDVCTSFACSYKLFWFTVVLLGASIQLRLYRANVYRIACSRTIDVPHLFSTLLVLTFTYVFMFCRSVLINPDPSFMNLGFLIFWLVFMFVHMQSNSSFKAVRPIFLLVSIYSAFVLLARYVYQFSQLAQKANEALGSSQTPLNQIGLVAYGSELFVHLLPDVVMFLACIFSFQILLPSKQDTQSDAESDHVHVIGWFSRLESLVAGKRVQYCKLIAIRLLVVHTHHAFLFLMACTALAYYSLIGFGYLLLTVAALFSLAAGMSLHYRVVTVAFSCATLVFYYVFRLQFFPGNDSPGIWLWLGLDDRSSSLLDSGGWSLFLLVIAGVALGRIRRLQSRDSRFSGIYTIFPVEYEKFPSVSHSTKLSLMYFVDHFFELWSFEICVITMLVVAVALSTVVSFLYLFCALSAFFFRRNRRIILWTGFLFTFSVIVLVQYFFNIGVPNGPNNDPNSSFVEPHGTTSSETTRFLSFQPDHPYVYVGELVVCFVLALSIRATLRMRKRHLFLLTLYGVSAAPDRSSVSDSQSYSKGETPSAKTRKSQSFIQRIQEPFLSSAYLLAVVFVFIVAIAQPPNMFNIGYIMFCFVLLIKNKSIMMSHGQPLWTLLGFYNFLVILLKIAYKIPWPALHDTDWRQIAFGLYNNTSVPRGMLSISDGCGGDLMIAAVFLLQGHLFSSMVFVSCVLRAMKRSATKAPSFALFVALLRESRNLIISTGEEKARKERRSRLDAVRLMRNGKDEEALKSSGMVSDVLRQSVEEEDTNEDAGVSSSNVVAASDSGAALVGEGLQEHTAADSAAEAKTGKPKKRSLWGKIQNFSFNFCCQVCVWLIFHSEPHPDYALDYVWNSVFIDAIISLRKDRLSMGTDVAVFKGLSKNNKGVVVGNDATNFVCSSDPLVAARSLSHLQCSLLWNGLTQRFEGIPTVEMWKSVLFRMWFFLRCFTLSHLHSICYVMFCVNFLAYGSLISLIFPLTGFYFAMTRVPYPTHKYWIIVMWITALTVLVKYIFALPFFCVCHGQDGNTVHFYSYCDSNPSRCNYSPDLQNTRVLWESFVGITQYPLFTSSFFSFLVWDVLIFLSVFYFRLIQRKKGHLRETFSANSILKESFSMSMHDVHCSAVNPVLRSLTQFHIQLQDEYNLTYSENLLAEKAGVPNAVLKEADDDGDDADADADSHSGGFKRRWKHLTIWKQMMFAFIPQWLLVKIFGPKKNDAKKTDANADCDSEEEELREKKLRNEKRILRRMLFPGIDLFSAMMITEMISLIILFFSYNRLFRDNNPSSASNEGIASSVSQSQISGIFVVSFMVQVFFFVMDRMVYVQRSVKTKLLMQFVFCIPLYMIILPYILCYDVRSGGSSNRIDSSSSSSSSSRSSTRSLTAVLPLGAENPFFANLALLFLTVFKCIYLGLSSMQIGAGYPRLFVRSLDFSFFSYCWFVTKRSLPFLFEIRALIDWTTLRTSLQLFEWLKVEDVFAEVYKRKCDVEDYRNMNRQLGEKQPLVTKIFSGVLLILLVLLVLFLPLIYYSTLNPALTANYVSGAQVEIGIGVFTSLYQSSRPSAISGLSSSTIRDVVSKYRSLAEFQTSNLDDQFIEMATFSNNVWGISPGNRLDLLSQLNSTTSKLELFLAYSFERAGPVDNRIISGGSSIFLSSAQKLAFYSALSGSGSSVVVDSFYSPFLRLKPYGDVEVIDSTLSAACTLTKNGQFGNASNPEYWAVACVDIVSAFATDGMYFITGSDEITQTDSLTGSLQSYSIIAFYATFVLAVGRFLRMAVSGLAAKIIIEDLPEPIEIIRLVLMIYEARDQADLILEELLFRELILIYRSPEMLLKLTEDHSAQRSMKTD
eukprot:ANDGO_03755.mRNA.1 Protein PIEZO homolog